MFLEPTVPTFRYRGDADLTASVHRGKAFTLGDVGYLDDDGYLFLRDRAKDMIISGGVNIYPAEAEAVLIEHPAVADVAVIGLPDDEWGETVHAVVSLRPGNDPSDELGEELMAFVARAAGQVQVPAHRRVPRRTATHRERQALEATAARRAPSGRSARPTDPGD